VFVHASGCGQSGRLFFRDVSVRRSGDAGEWAKAIGKASQTTNTVLGLEKNGVLTGLTLTLAAGTAGSEVNASATPALNVAAGDVLRWKVVSGPATVEEMAYGISVNMNVK
jgi:hypothetical protein